MRALGGHKTGTNTPLLKVWSGSCKHTGGKRYCDFPPNTLVASNLANKRVLVLIVVKDDKKCGICDTGQRETYKYLINIVKFYKIRPVPVFQFTALLAC